MEHDVSDYWVYEFAKVRLACKSNPETLEHLRALHI